MEAGASRASHPGVRTKLIEQLQTVHALKSGALRMFGPMLAEVRKEKDRETLPEVLDLLENMTNAFGGHEETTRSHERRLRSRLRTLGASASRPREIGLGLVATLRGQLGRVGGQNHGAAARDAFVFEHLEIVSWELLEHLAERAGDQETADLARDCRADDDEMAALIRRNFPNVLSLMLAADGLPTLRESYESDSGEGGQDGEPQDGGERNPDSEPEERTGVEVTEAARLLEEGEALVLDVRDEEEWSAGHIPDAMWVPMEEVEGRLDDLPSAKRVVTVCRSGKRSSKVAAQLREHGFEADNVEGGMEAWQEAGLSMEPPHGRVT